MQEITEFFAENFVTKIEIFHLLPVKVMATVLNKMKVRLFLPNDIICKQGAKENYLCLIYVGTAAVYVNDNKEVSFKHIIFVKPVRKLILLF